MSPRRTLTPTPLPQGEGLKLRNRRICMTTLFGLKNCATCKKATKWLDRFGVAYSFVDYRDDKRTPETLLEWSKQAGGWDALINKSSTTWRQLPENRKTPGSDAE